MISRHWSAVDVHADTFAGITAPGYEQRRAERIKEAYGIDVPVKA